MPFHIFEMQNLFNTIFTSLIFGRVVFCSFHSSSSDEVTLTTAKRNYDTSPKPSIFHENMHIQRRMELLSSTPLDLFRVKETGRRTQINSVWKWDYWCQLQPKVGSCSAVRRHKDRSIEQHPKKRQSFYYDSQLDTCLTFTFSGCGGNQNNFISLMECERYCKGSTYMSYKESSRTSYCGLQPNAGLCMDLMQRYYYDVNEGNCKTFVYGGCGGNLNRFKTNRQCQEYCKGHDV